MAGSGQRSRATWWWLWTSGVVAGLLTLWVAYAALTRPAWSMDPDSPWYLPSTGNGWFALGVGVAWAIFILLWMSRLARSSWRAADSIPSSLVGLVALLASVGGVLGLSALSHCSGGVPVLGPITNTLLLFAGNLDDGLFGDGAVCPGPDPLAIEMARFATIAATFAGAVVALLVVSRRQWDRHKVQRASAIDLVVGLNALSQPLIRALVHESRARQDPDPEWVEEYKRPRTIVVVLHNEPDDPLVAEVRSVGAVVLFGNAVQPEVLRPLITHRRFDWRRRRRVGGVSLKRLYAVADRQEVNEWVLDAAVTVLQSTLAGGDPDPVAIPRLTVRMDDAREAAAFRLHRAGGTQWFIDALSADEILAGELLDVLADKGCQTIAIHGDTGLTIALLDEIAWRAWTADHLKEAHRKACATGTTTPAPPAARIPRHVILLGDSARRMYDEWIKVRAPAAHTLPADSVEARQGPWESGAADVLNVQAAALIVTSQSTDDAAGAVRLARLNPAKVVIAYHGMFRGVHRAEADDDRRGLLTRFGPALHRNIPDTPNGYFPIVPADSWTRLARHKHEYYSTQSPGNTPSGRPWGEFTTPAAQRLPEFYREDNLRQIRQLLAAVISLRNDLMWAPHTRSQPVQLSDTNFTSLAEGEHKRWLKWRHVNGTWTGLVRETDSVPPFHYNQNIRDWVCGKPFDRNGRLVSVDPPYSTADNDSLEPDPTVRLNKLHRNNVEDQELIVKILRAWGVILVAKSGSGA